MVVDGLAEGRGQHGARSVYLREGGSTACHLLRKLTLRVTSAMRVAARFLLLYFGCTHRKLISHILIFSSSTPTCTGTPVMDQTI